MKTLLLAISLMMISTSAMAMSDVKKIFGDSRWTDDKVTGYKVPNDNIWTAFWSPADTCYKGPEKITVPCNGAPNRSYID